MPSARRPDVAVVRRRRRRSRRARRRRAGGAGRARTARVPDRLHDVIRIELVGRDVVRWRGQRVQVGDVARHRQRELLRDPVVERGRALSGEALPRGVDLAALGPEGRLLRGSGPRRPRPAGRRQRRRRRRRREGLPSRRHLEETLDLAVRAQRRCAGSGRAARRARRCGSAPDSRCRPGRWSSGRCPSRPASRCRGRTGSGRRARGCAWR